MMTVLVVDDDQATRETLRMVLEDAGYLVEEAESGTVALEKVRSAATPLVVLLDLSMPQMSGGEVLQHVSDDPQLASRHAFAIVTAADHAHNRPELSRFSALGLETLQKPFDLDDLLEVVARAEQRLAANA